MTESRVALIGIIVSNRESVEQLNHLLSEYGAYIIGRMGLPYKERNISINKLSSISGVTQSTVNNIVSGRNNSVTVSTIKKIWDGLDITIQDFFDSL